MRSASRYHTTAAKLLKAYTCYVGAGGPPVVIDHSTPTSQDLASALFGRSFQWLRDEPDVYSLDDGEAYG